MIVKPIQLEVTPEELRFLAESAYAKMVSFLYTAYPFGIYFERFTLEYFNPHYKFFERLVEASQQFDLLERLKNETYLHNRGYR